MSYFVLLIHESHRLPSMDGGYFKNEGSIFDRDRPTGVQICYIGIPVLKYDTVKSNRH